MKKCLLLFSLTLLLVHSEIGNAQSSNTDSIKPYPLKWFASVQGGVQMSGFKDEDFIQKNFAPLFAISAGKWFTPYLALEIGYKGFYFNTIADDIKHHYGYYYGQVMVNMNQLIKPVNSPRHWSLNLHGGSGYFYNYYYNRPNICADLGIRNDFVVWNNLSAFLDLSAIIGWDIYQGDEDILPGASLGITYNF